LDILPSFLNTFIYYIGLIVFLKAFVFSVKFVNSHFLRKRKDLKERYGHNTWACVTGCTGGIGQSFAEELAREGFNIVLVSRSEAKLKETAANLKKINPAISTSIVVADFSKENSLDFYSRIGKEINKHDVSVLVNNAGIAYRGNLELIEESEAKEMVDLNCTSYVMITKHVIPQMLKREKRSSIIFVASCLGLYPMSGNAVYSASKSFNDFLGRGISHELSHKIDVMVLRPSITQSSMNPYDGLTTPAQVVNGTLRDLGYQTTTNGYILHSIFGALLPLVTSTVPSFISAKFMIKEFNKLRDERLERESEQKKAQ